MSANTRKLTPGEAAQSIFILHYKESRLDSWVYFEKNYHSGFCALVEKELLKMKSKKAEEILTEYKGRKS